MYNAILLTNKNDTKCGLQNKNYAKMSLHFRWPKRDEMKCYNFISSRYYYYYSVFLFPVFHFRGCIWSHCALPQAPLAALFRRQQQTKLCLTQRKGQMASQAGFVFGRKRRNDIWKNFYYIEVEKKTECVVEKDGEKCSVVKRPGTSVQSRY